VRRGVRLPAGPHDPGRKVTCQSQQAAAYYDPERPGAYPTCATPTADVADITAGIEELVRLGCTASGRRPQYAALLDPELREGFRRRGSDPDRLIDACIEMDNAVIAEHPGVAFGLHICRGNNQSMFYASGGYEPIARVFSRSRFPRFLLEYDDQRSGGFEPLRAMPEDRTVVLGLVTTKTPRLESVAELRARVEEAARFVPWPAGPEPQCGFATMKATASPLRTSALFSACVARRLARSGGGEPLASHASRSTIRVLDPRLR
jgi:5-methyltetrahydropteroyltriglutamate--homocysteine methyltransferase